MGVGIFVKGLVVGLAIAVPVGPIGVRCVQRTLVQGRAAGLVAGLGAATADALYAAIATFGLAVVAGPLAAEREWLRLAGGLVLGSIGLRTLLAEPAEHAAPVTGRSLLGGYASTFLLTLSNPLTILSLAAVFAGVGVAATDHRAAAVLVLGVFLGSALWWLLLAAGVSFVRVKVDPRQMRWVNRLAGAVIVMLGATLLVGLR